MKKNIKYIIFYAVLFAVIAAIAWAALRNGGAKQDELQYGDLADLFRNEQVKRFEVSGKNVVTVETQLGDVKVYQLRDFAVFYSDFAELIEEQKKNGIIENYEYEPVATTPWWLSMIPSLLIIAIMAFIWIYLFRHLMNGAGNPVGGFGKSRAKMLGEEKNVRRIYFKDVAGCEEEKAELTEIVDFLKNPAKYTRLGAKIPHGVLLMGPPGTGKTLLAKAVAGEAGVPFYSISGSDFVELYVGVGASRVRDLFETAKKNPASIIFIDEIDAVGRHRGAGLGGGHDEREQTLNQLLVEMDGFNTSDGTIVIAATNRSDVLDPALLRPGRFDRQITVGYPDIRGREEILIVHAKGKPFESDIDFRRIAQITVGCTGADLANLLNEAALLAARRGKALIGMDEINDSYMKMLLGPQKKSKIRREKDTKLAAYHEAGHAIAAFFSPGADPVRHISIIPAGMAGGVTVMVPEEDAMGKTKGEMFDSIVVDLGGRVAEELTMSDISTGASSDISHATQIAKNMVVKYGMSSLGPILFGSKYNQDEIFLGRDFSNEKSYSEDTAAQIDREIRKIIDEAYDKCKQILTEHIDKLKLLAEYLIHSETCDGDQLKALIEGEPTFEELDRMVEEKIRKSREENERRIRMMNEEVLQREAERGAKQGETEKTVDE